MFTSKKLKKIFIFVLFLFCIEFSFAITRTAVNGDWNVATTWSPAGLPQCGDTIIIPSNVIVQTGSDQIDLTTCGLPTIIYIYGTLKFDGGKKLRLACNSAIYVVNPNGLITAKTLSGNNNLIEICGNDIWWAGLGEVRNSILTSGGLPITLLSFNAKCFNGNTNITWSSATETNNDFYTLENSIDAKNWNFVANIQGAGNSNEVLNYQYTNEKTLGGLSYYRLKQTDFDGKSEIFSPVSVICSSVQSENLTFYPNPFNSELVINYNNLDENNARIRIIDILGKIIIENTIPIFEGSNNYLLNLQDIPNGLYSVEFISGYTQFHQKILKN